MMDADRATGGPRPAVIAPDDSVWEAITGQAGAYSVRIDLARVGAPNLVQRLLRLDAEAELVETHSHSEDVMYVVTGTGRASYSGHDILLRPGLGLLVPAGEEYRIRAETPLELLSVLAPPPGHPDILSPADAAVDQQPWIHEADEAVIAAGDDPDRDLMDRYFKLMIDPRHGAHYVTQFLGFIERSKAAPHTHAYDEVIYITGGEGIVHIGEGSHPIGPGHSVYLPPGAVHCLENRTAEPLALLGVFCPAGSPREREKA